jgi:hypothetical protein
MNDCLKLLYFFIAVFGFAIVIAVPITYLYIKFLEKNN